MEGSVVVHKVGDSSLGVVGLTEGQKQAGWYVSRQQSGPLTLFPSAESVLVSPSGM